MAPRESFNVCFRYRRPEAEANRFNLALRTRLYQRGIEHDRLRLMSRAGSSCGC